VLQQGPSQEDAPLRDQAARGGSLALAQVIQRRLPPASTGEMLLAVYEQALATLWTQLVPLMDHPAVRAIFDRAIQRARRRQPLAGQIQVAETRPDCGALRAQVPQLAPETLSDALAALAQEIDEVVASLIGPELFVTLLGDVELELIRQGAGHEPGNDHPEVRPYSPA
jgi:hypothetical protein